MPIYQVTAEDDYLYVRANTKDDVESYMTDISGDWGVPPGFCGIEEVAEADVPGDEEILDA